MVLELCMVLSCPYATTLGRNLIASSRLSQPAESRAGALNLNGAAFRLADPVADEGLEWTDGVDAFPAIVEIDLGRRARLSFIVCRWAWLPSDYAVLAETLDGWETVASVEGNTIVRDKICLHILEPIEARRLRLVIRGSVSKERRCGWRAIEVYEGGRLPESVQRFLDRRTPCQYARADTPEGSLSGESEPLDREILDADIPRWEPIPRRLYTGRPEGKRVNELAGRRTKLLNASSAAYLRTSCSAYADKAKAVLFAGIDHWGRYQTFRFVGRNWQAVTFQDPAYNLTSMFRAYDRIADALTPTERLRFLYFGLDLGDFQYRSMVEFIPLAEQVTKRSDIYNWVPNSFGSLALAAAYLREFPETQRWLEACDRRFPGLFKDVFFLRDGTWWECSPAHHAYVLKGVYKYALAKHLLGEPIWTKEFFGLSVADTFEALAKTANPHGEFPSVNDSYGHDRPIRTAYPDFVRAATMMTRGDMLCAWRAEPDWPAAVREPPHGVEVSPPSYASILMEHAGQAVLRDGWGRDEAYLFLDYGPHGGGHGHLDKLSFAMVADGHHWIPDAGCAPHYCIFPEQWKWHKQTISHNTVLVDGKSQAESTGRLVHWETTPAFDLVSVEHRDGYASRGRVRLRLDGKPHTLTITPRELTPLDIAAVRLEPTGGGQAMTLFASSFEVEGGKLVDDPNVPGGKAARLASKEAVLSIALPARHGSFALSVLGTGKDTSHDSVYLALDGRRIGDAGLGVREYAWKTVRGPVGRVVHRRTIYHPRGACFLIHDTLTAEQGGTHKLEWLLHVYGEFVRQRPCELEFRKGDRGLLVVSPDIGAEPIAMEKGLCGGFQRDRWKGKGYPTKGAPGWISIPFFRLPKQVGPGNSRADYWVLLVPFVGEVPACGLKVLLPSGGRHAVRVSMGDRTTTFRETYDPFMYEVDQAK